MTDNSKRPWWADPQAVADNLARREFDIAFEYLQGLSEVIESAIAYGPSPAEAALAALAALEVSTYADIPQRVLLGVTPGAPWLHLQDQEGD